MGFFATKKEITEEAANYNQLKFFNKSKNVLVGFIVFVSLITFFLGGVTVNEMITIPDGMLLAASIVINLILAFFIYMNHRWAMVIFCLIYAGDKLILITQGAFPMPQIIFAAIAIMATVASYRVATQLRK